MKQQETERKCIVTGEVKPKEALLRFVVTQDGQLLPDLNKKFAGRGLYVSNSRQALAKALSGNLFVKAVRRNLKIQPDMLQTVEKLLYKKGLDSINLGIKAGAVVSGFEKVKDKLARGHVAFIIQASDAAPDGCRKIEQSAAGLPVLKVYASADFDASLDRVNTMHLAVLKGPMEKMVYENVKKYQDFLD